MRTRNDQEQRERQERERDHVHVEKLKQMEQKRICYDKDERKKIHQEHQKEMEELKKQREDMIRNKEAIKQQFMWLSVQIESKKKYLEGITMIFKL